MYVRYYLGCFPLDSRILNFFQTTEDEYAVIFTSGATGAIKLVGEYFDYGDDGAFCYLNDNHTSVLGIREYAARRGAAVECVDEKSLVGMTRATL